VSENVLLRATRLTKTYGSLVALAEASIAVRAGEVRALVGANGAGKSTLIKILTGPFARPPERSRSMGTMWNRATRR
jgi:ABC-type sugar transport system ATPase subunit